jgi:hypothetical protein
MNGFINILKKQPVYILSRVLVTDGDPAVNTAVMIQFSNTFHMYCIWHISQNLPKQLKEKLDSDRTLKNTYKTGI